MFYSYTIVKFNGDVLDIDILNAVNKLLHQNMTNMDWILFTTILNFKTMCQLFILFKKKYMIKHGKMRHDKIF